MIIFLNEKYADYCIILSNYFYNLHRYGEVKSKNLFLLFILLKNFPFFAKLTYVSHTSPSIVIAIRLNCQLSRKLISLSAENLEFFSFKQSHSFNLAQIFHSHDIIIIFIEAPDLNLH